MSVELNGADQFVALSRRLKAAGDRDLQRELSAGITKAIKPLKLMMRKAARDRLPKRGGLNERVARSRISVKKSVARGEGIRVSAGGRKSQLQNIDRGTVRHPVHGNRRVWVDQAVDEGWWSDPTAQIGPEVKRELEQAIARVARKVAG